MRTLIRTAAPGGLAAARSEGYIPALDGLRGVSILLVVLAHAGLEHIVPGGLGVTLFFFISGYIITRLMLAEREAGGRIDIGAFYVRRFFRLMPALSVYVAFCILALLADGARPAWQDLAAVFFYFSNYWNIGQHFQPGMSLASPFTITWSLAVEEHYYLLYPLLFAALARHKVRLLGCVAALLLAALAWRLWLAHGVGLPQLPPERIYMGSDTRLDSILYGAGTALLERFAPGWRGCLAGGRGGALGLSILLSTLLFRDAVFRETWRYALQGAALALMWPWLLESRSWPRRWLESAVLVRVGRISYSLYLYHWLARVLLQGWWPDLGVAQRLVWMLALSLPAAYLSWRWVERGGLALRRRVLRQRPAAG